MSAPRRSNRSAARKITKSIAKIAAQDLDSSDDEDLDITMVNSDYDNDERDEDPENEDEKEDSDDAREEEDEEDEEDDNEPVVVPAKRKRGKGKKTIEKTPLVRDILVTIAVYTAEQMKKSRTSRGSPKSDLYTLTSDEPWDTLKAQIGVRICGILNPAILDLDNYDLTFTVPRHISDPIKLSDETHYKHLLKTALTIKTGPSARVIVEPKPAANEKENDDAGQNGSKAKNGGEKTKVRKERDILPGNVALNEKIGLLRDKWRCPTPGAPCGSEHCFVHPTDPEHFPLSHAHMESWGAAWLKGTQFADLNKPPNNELFDKINPASLAARSPLLQRRLELNQKAPVNATPTININFPPEIAGLLGRAPAVAALPAPAPAPAQRPRIADPNAPLMLIPINFVAGPSLTIDNFCKDYNLDEEICARFKQNRFKTTDAFAFIGMAQLTTMEFMVGEIAELQVAIGKWSVVA
ncbi:hypothetical protein B0H16DRAFT_1721009 [Mycena metata]|uniref:Uncharacterized protein n=1 Tax=Mycena metata TaxID=1033252 RepID=A0AAD7NFT9_9AGAR|nr:hypothetical protein B0H16DRAFT_1721009 [Mycena metata]